MFKNTFNPIASIQAFGTIALETTERLSALSIAQSHAMLNSIEQNQAIFESYVQASMKAKTLNDMVAPYMEIVVPALAKSLADSMAFAEQVTAVHRDSHVEIKSQVKAHAQAVNQASSDIVNNTLKLAPAGSNKFSEMIRSGFETARGTADQVAKIADQMEKTAEAATAVVVAQAKKASAVAKARKA